MSSLTKQKYAAIVVGAGPAGISAAMGFLEGRLDCLLLDSNVSIGGQLVDIPSEIVNWAGGTFKNGLELSHAMQRALRHAQLMAAERPNCLTIQQETRVTAIIEEANQIIVKAENAAGKLEYVADYVLVATGYRLKKIAAPINKLNQSDLLKHWHYHLDTLPKLEADVMAKSTWAVVGGGDSALLKTLHLAPKLKAIHLICRSEKLKARPDLIARIAQTANCTIHWRSSILKITGTDTLETIVLAKKEDAGAEPELLTIAATEVLVKVGYEPNSELLVGSVKSDESGHILVDQYMQTSAARLYSAGDIINPLHPRIASAVGQGMIACGAILGKYFAQSG